MLLPPGTGRLRFLSNLVSYGHECVTAFHFDFADWELG